jgi:hypothetical protein
VADCDAVADCDDSRVDPCPDGVPASIVDRGDVVAICVSNADPITVANKVSVVDGKPSAAQWPCYDGGWR